MKHLVVILILAGLWGCGNNPKKNTAAAATTSTDKEQPIEISYPVIIDANKSYTKKDVSIQDIVGEVEYVKLETTLECFVSMHVLYMQFPVVTASDIIMYGDDALLRFDRNGKFLNKIGRQGRGPQEHVALSDYAINENTKEVFLGDGLQNQVLVFDFDGNFIRKFRPKRSISDMVVYNDSTLFVANALDEWLKNPPYSLISAQDGTVIKDLHPPYDKPVVAIGNKIIIGQSRIFNQVGRFTYSDYSTDTIYSLSSAGTPEPRIIKIPGNDGKALPDHKYIMHQIESEEMIVVGIVDFELRERFYVINKFTGEINHAQITNRDIDKSEWSVIFAGKTPRYTMPYDAIRLIELRDAGKLSGKLAEVAAGLTEEDNPVIMIQK